MAISFVNAQITPNVSGTTVVITKPTGLADGDVMIAHIFTHTASPSVPSGPAGWVLLDYRNQGGVHSDAVFYKVVTNAAGEAANYTFTTASGSKSGSILAYRGVSINNPIATYAGDANFSTTATAPSITTIRDASMIVVTVGVGNADPISNPGGLTIRSSDEETVTSPSVQVGEAAQAVAGATSTYAHTITNGSWIARSIALNAAPVNEILFVASTVATGNSVTSLVVNKPTGTVDGDLMLMVVGKPIRGWTVPAGWTLLHETATPVSSTGSAAGVYWRIAASEGASYTWNVVSSTDDIGVIIATYRNTKAVTPIDVSAESDNVSSTGINVPNATSTIANALAVHIGVCPTKQTTITPAIQPVQRGEVDSVVGVIVVMNVGDELLGAAGTVTGRDMTLGTADVNYGVLVVLAPSVPSGRASMLL